MAPWSISSLATVIEALKHAINPGSQITNEQLATILASIADAEGYSTGQVAYWLVKIEYQDANTPWLMWSELDEDEHAGWEKAATFELPAGM